MRSIEMPKSTHKLILAVLVSGLVVLLSAPGTGGAEEDCCTSCELSIARCGDLCNAMSCPCPGYGQCIEDCGVAYDQCIFSCGDECPTRG